MISEQYINNMIENKPIGVIYFLPTEFRPITLPPLPIILKDSKYWHTGIAYNNKCYECFNFGRYRISQLKKRYKEFPIGHVDFINYYIDLHKLQSEINSGTSCSEYVAKVTGLSNRTGYNKGIYFPDDIFRILKEKYDKIRRIEKL